MPEQTKPEVTIHEMTERHYFDTEHRRIIYRRVTNISGRVVQDGYVGLCVVTATMSDGRQMQKEDQFTINATSVGQAFEYFDRDLEEFREEKTKQHTEELTKPRIIVPEGYIPPLKEPRSFIGGDGRTSRHAGNNGKAEGE